MVFSGLPGGLLLLLAASVEDFPERLPDPFGGSFADLARSLGCAFANVLTPLAHILARAGPSFVLIVLRLVLRPRLRLGGFLILRWVRGAREGGQTQENGDARRHKNRAELGPAFISFLLLMDSNDNHFIRWFDASKSGRLHAQPLSEVCTIFLN